MATPAHPSDRVIRLVVVIGMLFSATGFSVPRSSAVTAQSATVPLGSADAQGTPEASPTPEPGATPAPGVTPQPSETPDLNSTAAITTTTLAPVETPVESPAPAPTETPPPQPAPSVADLIPGHLLLVSATPNPTDDSESAIIPRAGGAVSFMRGRVTVIAEADTFADDVIVTFRPESAAIAAGQPVSATTRTISTTSGLQIVPTGPEEAPLRFRLEASRVADGGPIESFGRPVQMVVDLRGLPGVAARPGWYLAYRDPTDPTVWHKVGVTVHDPAGLLSAETAHFSSWASGAEPGQWHFRWNPPAVSTFSGAATYQYPIEAPPGRNGLAPKVDLSYSSRGVDSHILSNMDRNRSVGL